MINGHLGRSKVHQDTAHPVIYQLFGFVCVETERAVLLEVPPKCCLRGPGAKEAGWLDLAPCGPLVSDVSHPGT